jgi:predicted DNA-binding protein (UPF0251 family)
VRCNPEADYFKPRGIPVLDLEEVVLLKDELEAVRLADLEERYQQDAADNMNISRQTFGNIIRSAHRKIADALVNGKALKIEGGVVNMEEREFRCQKCSHQWTVPPGIAKPAVCPKCKGRNIFRAPGAKTPAPAGRPDSVKAES